MTDGVCTVLSPFPIYSLSELITVKAQHSNLHCEVARRIKEHGWMYIDCDIAPPESTGTSSLLSGIPTNWQEILGRAFLLEVEQKIDVAGTFRGDRGVTVGYRKV